MTANPLAPLRYRPGKPTGQEDPSSESESESESEDEQQQATSKAPAPAATSFPKISANLSKDDLEKRRQDAIAARAREAELASKAEEGFETASDSGDDSAASGSEDGSSEEDESSEDEAPQRRFIAPTFVKKNQRNAMNKNSAPEKTAEEVAAEEERRRQEKADEMLQAQIEKDMAEKAAGRRAWDDDDEAISADVDDADDVDPEAERAAWKLRELKRVKREREVIEVAEKEREEVERRRNLSATEREAEDKEFIEAQQAEREGKGQMGFMQKYFHKGAFFQGEEGEAEEAAKRRDIMGARYADDAVNRELLPQYMQIRDMTKLGKKGRTKYRDMKTEDTGRWGGYADMRGPQSGGDRYKKDQEGPSGANASAVGERKRRDDDRQGGRDEKRPRFD